MRSRTGSITQWLALVAGLFSGLVASRTALATTVDTDARWQPWIGCWEAISPDSSRTMATGRAPRLCVLPANGSSAVEIATVVGDSIVARHTIEASDTQRETAMEGCKGWERANWAPNGQRVYFRSSATCAGGLVRRTNGVFAISPTGDWIDVQGVASGTAVGVRVTRYRDVTTSATLPREIVAALRGRESAVNLARIAAMAPLTTADVVEASRALDTGVLETLLVERRQGFELDAKRLVALDKGGVAPSVIDVMVALTYPRVFALDGSRVTGSTVTAEDLDDERYGRTGTVVYADPRYDPWGYDYWPYYGYGYGYGSRYSGWYYGSRPIIVVRQPSDGTSEPEPHGQVVKGRGYTSDRTRSGDGGGSSSASGKSGSSGSSGKASSSGSTDKKSSGSGSGEGRTAKRRPPQ